MRARLVEVGGHSLLFSSSEQEIYQLNETAADIWRAVDEGATPNDIVQEIESCGVASAEARAHVAAALGDWERRDLIHPVAPAVKSCGDASRLLGIADLRVRLTCRAPDCERAISIFRHLEVADGSADLQLDVVEVNGRLQIFREDEWISSCSRDELPTALKGQLLTEVLDHGSYELAVHAAALLNGGRALLLSGRPGAGKTTLAMALVHAGFGFGGDDVTLLNPGGRCVPLPFAPAVKAGSWPILGRYLPGLGETPVFRRPDRRRVRYPVPDAALRQVECAVGWVVMLDRCREGAARLHRVDPAEALGGLLGGSFALGGDLTDSAFEAMAQVVGGAETFRLSYCDLDDAVRVLAEACR